MDETNNTNQWMDLPHPVLFLSVQSHLPQRDDELRVHSGQILRLLKQRSGWVEVLYRDQVGWCPLACLGDQVLDEKESALDPALKWDWVRWFLRRSQNNSHMWQQNLNEEQMDKLRLETMFRNAEETVDTCSSPVDSIQDDSSLSSPLPQGPSATGATSDASSEMLLDYILSEEAFLRELMDLMQVCRLFCT